MSAHQCAKVVGGINIFVRAVQCSYIYVPCLEELLNKFFMNKTTLLFLVEISFWTQTLVYSDILGSCLLEIAAILFHQRDVVYSVPPVCILKEGRGFKKVRAKCATVV